MVESLKNLSAMQETQAQSLSREDPLEKGMATHSSILAWKSYGQRSLEGYSPWGQKSWELEMGIPDHLMCLLRNLYAGQEATVRTVEQ